MSASDRYRILRKLGEGGMGVVYAAHDERLDRPVAIKRIRPDVGDGLERQRLWREARTSASVSHPNVCQLYEIDEDAEGLFLAMELLEGEPLSARLARGALLPDDAVQTALGVLGALTALHQKGIVHRDLKPSNIFLSPHGVKLLDFGLARPIAVAETIANDLTRPGVVFGTPRYMAPETIEGREVDARSDLFVLGIVLYEMLAGRPPFRGTTMFEVSRAILHDEPPPLGGSARVVALDRTVHRALRKPVDERYQTAGAFAHDVRAALLVTDPRAATPARAMTRLVVAPFRALRPDPAVDYLTFSLPDAISSALSGLPSLVVRSTAAASRCDPADIPALARALDVDVVVLGTLLSSGDEVRVSAQLVEAPTGTLIRAMTAQSSTGDIFGLQDRLTQTIVESLSIPLTTRDQALVHNQAPATPEAYECYLRANQIRRDAGQWTSARDLYLRCVEQDPDFAPAWARLGHCYRLLGRFGDAAGAAANLARGEQALERALRIDPDLSVAHNLYAQAEVEGGRAQQAMVRLIARIRQESSQPELLAGLVHACRYCGLHDASIAAYERARRFDPGVVTSVAQTFLQRGDLERAIATDSSEPPFTKAMALVRLGRQGEGVALLRAALEHVSHPQLHVVLAATLAFLEGRHGELVRLIRELSDAGFGDPEGFFHWAGALAHAGEHDDALRYLERCMDNGYHPAAAIAEDPRFDPVRTMPRFVRLVRRADALQREAVEAFGAAGGPATLGLPRA